MSGRRTIAVAVTVVVAWLVFVLTKEANLWTAAYFEDIDRIRVLVKEGVNVNEVDATGNTALHYAAQRGNATFVEQLLQLGADASATNIGGSTPLHWVRDRGSTEVIALLIAHGARINAQNTNGETALHWAAGFGHVNKVEALLRQGADARVASKWGDTAVHQACSNAHESVVRALIDIGKVDANLKDDNGNTPLHIALNEGYCSDKDVCSDIAHFLVQRGARMDIKNNKGETALPLDPPSSRK